MHTLSCRFGGSLLLQTRACRMAAGCRCPAAAWHGLSIEGMLCAEFTTSLPFAKTARGRLAVDEHLQVLVPRDEATATADITHPCQVEHLENGLSSAADIT